MKKNGGGDRCAGVRGATGSNASSIAMSSWTERKAGELNQRGAWSGERYGALDAGTGPDWPVMSHRPGRDHVAGCWLTCPSRER